MLDCDIVLTGKYPEKAAHKPPAGIARIECERAVDQPDHRTDVLAEHSQHVGAIGEDARVVLPHIERLPSEIDGLARGCLRRFGPAVSDDRHMTDRRPG